MTSENQGGFDKKGLLALAEKIISANQGTIDILKDTPVCNLKTVQRNAKNLKDPAPLQSMIAVIGTKYPLSVDSAKAAKHGIPLHFLDRDDAHQFGRRRCKLEAVPWFLENMATPDEGIKEAIDILFRAKKAEVQAHYSVPWRESRVRFGKTCLQRQLVPTQEVVFKVPHNQRVEYLMTALMPHLSIMYPSLDPTIVKELKVLSNLRLESKLTIQSQLRILLDLMDPKMRYMPALPEYPHSVNRVRYVYASGNHLILVPVTASRDKGIYTEILTLVGKVCWYLLNNKRSPEEIRAVLQCCTFRGVSLLVIVHEEVDTINMYLKLLFAVMGLPIYVEKVVRGYTFTPISGNMRQELTRNSAGTRYASYIGTEKVQVRGEGFIANVTRHEDVITRIVLQRCDFNIFLRALAAISVYIKIGFHTSKARSIRAMEEETFEGATKDPAKYLRMSREEIKTAWKKDTGYRKIAFEEYIEPTPKAQKYVTVEGTTIHVKGGQDFNVQKPRIYPLLPIEFRCQRSLLNDFMSPPVMLRSKIAYYVHEGNFAEMMRRAQADDWNWLNECIMEGVEPTQRIQVAVNARYAFRVVMEQQGFRHYLAYLYCLCHYRVPIAGEVAQDIEFRFYNSLRLSLYLTTPDATMVDGEFRIAGSVIARYEEGVFTSLIPIFLRGYRLLENYDGPFKITSVPRAAELAPNLKPGSVLKVFLFGREYFLERDLFFELSVQRTIAVRTSNINLPSALLNLISLNKRVHDEADISTVPVKKPRCEEVAGSDSDVEDVGYDIQDLDEDIELDDL
uniref:Polymerase PB2 n=3 Tax=Orthomyxoviridae TaxID=11308 RepID=A0A894KLH9_9ORTO|nr:MAG: polymerase PB2 [Guadeloupe mosquito quaranja-like virus 1]QRW42588.1 MAG: polymerase PB2 [Guadeloupe mosquito quaranja-like virus 1]QRW42589.1 MAG: polymerase PB2 [Guadeloupe mosquito quaranja-like virus 1]QRW42590.1 MAG: polymerase PB2 [Guadeloupe mosquito quaranja-like virus 1]UGO48656.1 MAG: polymerase PB2 [Palmetto orthomyxo-like virus]